MPRKNTEQVMSWLVSYQSIIEKSLSLWPKRTIRTVPYTADSLLIFGKWWLGMLSVAISLPSGTLMFTSFLSRRRLVAMQNRYPCGNFRRFLQKDATIKMTPQAVILKETKLRYSQGIIVRCKRVHHACMQWIFIKFYIEKANSSEIYGCSHKLKKLIDINIQKS